MGYRTRQDQPEPGGAFFPNRGERGGPDQTPVAFEEGEVGSRDEISVVERLDRGPAARLPQQPGENRARFGVDDQRSPPVFVEKAPGGAGRDEAGDAPVTSSAFGGWGSQQASPLERGKPRGWIQALG